MKIYFAASIRGGRNDVEIYQQMIEYLKTKGEVLTEHIGYNQVFAFEKSLTEKQIHDRDMQWLLSADIVVAEVTTPSLGVGYEIGRAIENNIPVLCLFRKNNSTSLSAMISGSDNVTTQYYTNVHEAFDILNKHLKHTN